VFLHLIHRYLVDDRIFVGDVEVRLKKSDWKTSGKGGHTFAERRPMPENETGMVKRL